jgi:hypothetical protein
MQVLPTGGWRVSLEKGTLKYNQPNVKRPGLVFMCAGAAGWWVACELVEELQLTMVTACHRQS